MFSKKNTIYLITFLTLAFTFIKPVIASDDDDDDNFITEMVIDISFGVFMAVCETSASCMGFMKIVFYISLVVAVIAFLTDPQGFCNNCCRVKTFRRGATSYGAYRLARR